MRFHTSLLFNIILDFKCYWVQHSIINRRNKENTKASKMISDTFIP